MSVFGHVVPGIVEGVGMDYQLAFTVGPDQGRVVELRQGESFVLGRDNVCDLIIHDPHVSRNHCRIEVTGEKAELYNTGSSYGTYVNGEKIERCRLKPGDVIGMGETEIRFGVASTPAASTIYPDTRPSDPVLQTAPTDARRPEPQPAGTGANVPSDGRLDGLIGQTFLRYEIGDPIAKGSSGMVFRAHDTKHNRPVAMKVLWPELSQDADEVQRFVRAIKTMMPIKHLNIISLHGAGVTDGFCWMVMEFVEGESLAQVIERIGIGGMLDWEHAFHAGLHIARALEVAHENSIVHRNITPRNILIRSDDRVAKLGDLMLAKALEGSMAETVTRAGELIGELAYMSPEQTKAAGDVDSRSDIYNLGATIYHLVCGRPPHQANNPAELIRKIQNEDPPKPTSFQLSIPPLFEGVILQMIDRNRDRRYAQATQLVRQLEQVAKYQGLTDV